MGKKPQRHGNKEQTDSDQRGGGRRITGERRGTCTKDPWIRTIGWGLFWGEGVGQGRGDQLGGGNGDKWN